MNYRQTITDAYYITRKNRFLGWFGFYTAILGILVGGVYLTYQGFALYHVFYFPENSFLDDLAPLFTFVKQNIQYSKWVLGMAGIIFFLDLFIPTLLEGAMIHGIYHIWKEENADGVTELSHSILSFLALFEYNVLTGTFSFSHIFFIFLFALRNLPGDIFSIVGMILIFMGIIGFFLSVLFTYSRFFIVVEKSSVIRAIMQSSKLVILHIRETLFLVALMILIAVRAVLNIIIVFGIPMLTLFFAAYFAAFITLKVSVISAIILGTILLYFAGRFSGTLLVFINAAWTLTFLELQAKTKDSIE